MSQMCEFPIFTVTLPNRGLLRYIHLHPSSTLTIHTTFHNFFFRLSREQDPSGPAVQAI